MQKKCLWKKVVPKHPFSLTAFGRFPFLSLRDIFPRSGGNRPSRGHLYAATAKFPATAKAVPVGKGCSRRAAASAGSRRGSCRLPLRPLLVKMQCRSVRRRSGIALLKIFFPLNMRKANAERIQNRPARSANAYSVSTRSNRSFAASTASLLPKATRTPPESTSDRAAACALSRAASTLHSALRSAVRISSVMPQKYR